MESDDRYSDVWKRIKDIRFAMLTTIDAEGDFASRPMTTQNKEFDGTLWFFASKVSPPAREIESHSAVGLQYVDHGDDVYVSMSGTARFDHDRARMEGFWNPMVKAWFPKGLDDPDLTLIAVDVHTAEYWDVKESKPVQLFKMAKAAVTGKPPEMGEHRTVAM